MTRGRQPRPPGWAPPPPPGAIGVDAVHVHAVVGQIGLAVLDDGRVLLAMLALHEGTVGRVVELDCRRRVA